MKNAIFLAALCACLVAPELNSAMAQNLSGPFASPADPNQLLLAAIHSNGLGSASVKPWHVRISFAVEERFSQSADHGTIEEWWVSSTHYKRSITATNFTQTEYGTESGMRRAGIRSTAPPSLTRFLNSIAQPIDIPEDAVPTLNVKRNDRTAGEAHFSCLATEAGKITPAAVRVMPEIYCVDAQHPILRFASAPNGFSQTFFNQIVLFNSRYVAKDVQASMNSSDGGKPKLLWSVKVEQLETLTDADAAAIDPPPGTAAAAPIITLTEKEARAVMVDHPKPVYPPIAQAARVSGDVTIEIHAGVDGRVSSLRVVSGPAMLQGAAVDAVKKWTFKPAESDGDTAEIETTITIPFRLAGVGANAITRTE